MKKIDNITKYLSQAISHYWLTRQKQSEKQSNSGRADQGARSAVTGGAQMDGFIDLITDLILEVGVDKSNVFRNKHLELPGFFRPTKEWDLLLVKDNQLVLALEAKSQVGPSFGNNFNNRTEEAMGSALDLWTAYREGAYNKTISHGWVICSSLKIALSLGNPSGSKNPISRFSPSLSMRLTPNVMNSSVGSLCANAITMSQPSLCQTEKAGSKVIIRNPRRISHSRFLLGRWLHKWQRLEYRRPNDL